VVTPPFPECTSGYSVQSSALAVSLPPDRNSFHPELNLTYSSSYGNGSFGQGWSLSILGVNRKMVKGVPRYQDTAGESIEWDTYILSAAEHLVDF
jgi:hypothetical protein